MVRVAMAPPHPSRSRSSYVGVLVGTSVHVSVTDLQLTDYSSNPLEILHSHHLIAAMALHYNMVVSNRWWHLNHHLGLYLSPAAAANAATVHPMEDFMPVEGIEAYVGVSVGTSVHVSLHIAPRMDEESVPFPLLLLPPMAPTASPPSRLSWREAAPYPSP
ncbi:uncharacterized protein N7515_009275 [Penicillium bovifimosum]|uniref:Uncharacterized protein n=1 Tax=Penicillium bovifimosum TaxID=126998 RepID=A0A9W9KVJ1_9EURO|nr:uncharacterized protein N7515_009275 [Penicillium bovifimosum]KAJ5121314.1 hypothetical protein N7515_009275 [Penicillium bovifimosum]